jgi:hypothetical protein
VSSDASASSRTRRRDTRTLEGIFVGYADNSHAYRYYNKHTGVVEVSCDMEFEENNGSQVEQVVSCDVGCEESSQAIKSMGIGVVLPKESKLMRPPPRDGDDSSSTQVEPSSSQVEPTTSAQDEPTTQDEPQTKE